MARHSEVIAGNLPLRRAAADHQGWRDRYGSGDGNRDLARTLNRHAAGGDGPVVLVGTGASQLLAHWSERYAAGHEDVFVFHHHVGCTAESRSVNHLVHRLLDAVRITCGLTEPVPVDPDARLEILPNWLARLAARGRSVIVLDRLDALEDTDADQTMEWLPDWLPAPVRLVVGVAPGPAAEMLGRRGWTVERMDDGKAPDDVPADLTPDSDAARVLSILWAVRRGLRREHLATLLPDQALDPALEQLGSGCFTAGERLTLSGPDLRDAVRRHLVKDGGERQALQVRIAGVLSDGRDADALDEVPWLLAMAGHWSGLAAFLGRRDVMDVLLTPDWREDLLDRWRQWGTGAEVAAFYLERLRIWRDETREDGLADLILRLVAALRELPDAEETLEPFYRAAMRMADDPDSVTAVSASAAYAAWLADRDRTGEAEPLLREALRKRASLLGPDHPDTRGTRHQLAMLLEARGDTDDALRVYRDALRYREETLGKHHHALIPHLTNLAAVQKAANALEEARSLYQRALAIAERQYGNAHPTTAACVDNLAGVLYAGQDMAEAENLYQRALGIAETAFGPEHPATAASAHNLATVLDAREQYQAAEALFRRALDIRRRVVGEDHMDTASSLHNLAGVLDVMGRYEEAEPMYRRAVETWEKVVGREHPATATSINNLADLLREKGEYGEAEALYRRNLDTWSTLLGDRHPHTVMTRSELAVLYADQGRSDVAEPLLREAAEQTAEVMGVDSMQHVNTVTRLAALLRDSGRRNDARRVLQDSVQRIEGRVNLMSPRLQKLRRHLEALDVKPDTLH